jgi:hypothetical protein
MTAPDDAARTPSRCRAVRSAVRLAGYSVAILAKKADRKLDTPAAIREHAITGVALNRFAVIL